jgi:hypothetical protein
MVDEDIKRFENEQKVQALRKEQENNETMIVSVTTVTTTTTTTTKSKAKVATSETQGETTGSRSSSPTKLRPNVPTLEKLDTCLFDPGHIGQSPLMRRASPSPRPAGDGRLPSNQIEICEDENSAYLGLRVYTNKDTPVVVGGRLNTEVFQPDIVPLSPLQ